MIIRFGKSSRQKNHADRIGGTLFPVKLAVYFKVVRHLEIIIKIIQTRIKVLRSFTKINIYII